MTNAEKIRTMNDEELADFLVEIENCGRMAEYFTGFRCNDCEFHSSGHCSKTECIFPISIEDDIKYWLNHEADL